MTLSGAGGGGSTGGGKGGSGAARTPVTDKDNLRSTQYASLVDVLCEGEIEGLVDGSESIFLNDTPIQNPDNSYNFDNVTVYARTGTQSQDAIPIASEIASEKSVGVAVTQATPIVRTITNPDVDAVRITISVPQMQMIEEDGDIRGSLFQIDIDVQYNGGGYQTKINEWVKGRTGDPWTRDYRVELNGAFPVDIRVSRENPDSSDPKITNAFTWQSYTEITYAKLSYPNTALVGLRVDAGQFSSIPSRKYRIRGRKIKLPSNATVDTTTHRGRVTYSGVWDGTFGAAQYSNDPAWCLWDLLHSSRAGFGDHIKVTDSDKWAFYAASQYCRELVPNGLGGMEPRFACNVNIQTQQDAYKLINDLCSVFRAMPFWAAGTLGLTQDRPADPAFLFNQSNVIDGIFNYSSSQKNRPTVVTAGYFDLDTRDIAYETVESQALIEQYGVVRKEIEAVATTSRGQARRVAEWMLYSEWNEPEVVAFKTSVDAGVMVRPGMVIEIADPARAGVRHGGRVVSATQTTVVLDSAEGLPASMTGCTLTLIMPSGVAETRPIVSRSGTTLILSPQVAFSVHANPLSPWNLSEPTVQTQLWRVLGMKETDGIEYAITAISHNPSKYGYIELDRPLEERDITNLNETPAPPASVSVEEVMYVERARARTKLVVSWAAVAGVTSYVLRWRLDAGNWEQLEVETNSGDVLDSKAGTYEIEVLSIGANLKRSTAATATTFAAEGNSKPPATPSDLVLTTVDVRTLLLRWAAPEPDVTYGGLVEVRRSTLTTGASWASSSTVLRVDGGALQAELPAMTGTYLVKFRDSAGNWSVAAASIASIYTTPNGRITVLALNEVADYQTPFSGRMDGVVYSAGALSIASDLLTGTYYPTTINRLTYSNLYGQDVIDLGTMDDVYIKEVITSTLPDGVTAQLFVSSANGPAVEPSLVGVTLNNNLAAFLPSARQPSWTDWREVSNDYIRGQSFRFKLVLTRTSTAINASITAYRIDLEMQSRTENGNQTVATLAYNPIGGITLPQYFPVPDSPFSGFHYAIDLSPSFIEITGGGGTASGMTAQVQPSTVYGKNIAYIQFRNGSNQITTPATFTWTVTGYGAENGTPIVSDDNSGAMTPAQMRKLDALVPFTAGTSAGDIVQLDSTARLPAVDGSQLLNLPSSGGGGSSAIVVVTRELTTGGVAPNASQVVVFVGGWAGLLQSLSINAAAWVTVYSSAAAISADANRAQGTPPGNTSGVVADLVAAGAQLLNLCPTPAFSSNDSPVGPNLYVKVRNTGGSTVGYQIAMSAIILSGTTPAPNTSGDQFLSYVELLLHMDGSNGSTSFVNSINNQAITPSGNTVISTAQSKFGGSSALFDGSGDWLTFPAVSIASTDDLTLECFIYPASTQDLGIFGDGTSGNNNQLLSILNNKLYSFWGEGEIEGGTVPANAWSHVAITRQSGVRRLFLNGALVGTHNTSTASFNVSRLGWTVYRGNFSGYIDEARVTKGIARYVAAFTPPTAPF